MSSGPEIGDRVPGFLYLDMERVKSISARLDEGYIEEQVNQREENDTVSSSIYGSIRAHILAPLSVRAESGGEVAAEHQSTRGLEETKALHHYYYDLLENWLEQADGAWFHDLSRMADDEIGDNSPLSHRFRSVVEEGDFVRVTGSLYFQDFKTSMELVGGFFDAIKEIKQYQADVIQQQISGENVADLDINSIQESDLNEFESVEPLFDAFSSVLPEEYQKILVAELTPDVDESLPFRATVQRDKLETTPEELLSKHQTSNIRNCTMLARVENITTPSENDTENIENVDDDSDFGELLDEADDFASIFGLKASYPQISVSPIAIYR